MEHVIALDPGGRSGWASARMSEDRFELTGGGVLRMDLMGRWFAEQQAVVYLYKPWKVITEPVVGYGYVDHPRNFDVMVYESWKPRRDEQGRLDWIEGDSLVNAQHVGQLRLIADLSGARIVEQHPSDKPQAVATMPAKLLELDRDSNEQHDKDARMHLWLYFWRQWFTASVPPESTVTV